MKNLIKKVYTCEKDSPRMWIGNALLWAAVIIIGAWLTRGSQHADALFLILLTASTTTFLFTDRQRKIENK